MYLKAGLHWSIVIPPKSLKTDGVKLQTELSRQLLDDFAAKRATEDLGNFIAVTTVDSIGQGKVRQDTGDITFPVSFSFITFKLFTGEIVNGVVDKMLKHGVCLRCGPFENVFLSVKKMPGYQYVLRGDDPVSVKYEMSNSRIGKNVTVRCVVIGIKWIEADRVFCVVVGLLDKNT